MNAQAAQPVDGDDDEMPAEVDFAGAERGKFYKPGMRFVLPVRLEQQVQDTLVNLARAKGVDYNALINDLLKKDIELIEMAR